MPEDTSESAPALKEIFNHERIRFLADETRAIHPSFDAESFMALACADLDTLGIMQRLRQIAVSFHATLPGGFERNLEILRELAPRINHGFASITLPEYVALYGKDHFEQSMEALKFFTRFGSSEFAIRHFLLQDMQRVLPVMEKWSLDDNEHVRRLSSEGCRPRLPWSFQLKTLISDPTPVAGILENLKSDPSLYVRKSIANHLNDITKDHPDWVLVRVATWPKENPHTAWIVKHALRTLIKKGDPQALAQTGVSGRAAVTVSNFSITPLTVPIGGQVRLFARLVSTAPTDQKLVVDYAVHYVKKSGATMRKVFKLRELVLEPGSTCELSIRRALRDFTTRIHYPGYHRVELIVNGETLQEGGFELTAG